jgi:hypothetical protein
LFKQVNEQPALPTSVKPELPPSVDIAIAWMMQKDRDKRPATVLEGVNALDPSASITPMVPPIVHPGARSSNASIPPGGVGGGAGPRLTPREIALAETGTSSSNALAETRPSDAMLQRRKLGYRGLWVGIGIVVVLGAGGTVAYLQLAPRQALPDATNAQVATVSEPVKQPAVEAVDAQAQPQPEAVQIKFVGVPDHAEVQLLGKTLGFTPTVKVPYGTSPIDVVLQLDGFQTVQATLTPDREQAVTVEMKPKKRTTGGARRHDKDAVESPFGNAHEPKQ